MKALYRRLKYRHIGLYTSKWDDAYVIQLSNDLYVMIPYFIDKPLVLYGTVYKVWGCYEVL